MSRQPGLSLADIGNIAEDFPIGESYVTVHGISCRKALDIFRRFPNLAKLASGFGAADLLAAMPDAVAAILVASMGGSEEDADNLPIELQLDLLEVIGRLTFKNGFGPFVQRVMALGSDVAKSVPSIREMDTKSPPASKASSLQDIL
jgi:hypothetical protein